MSTHRIRKGLDLPLQGAPSQDVDQARPPRQVALLGADYVGLKPTMRVQPGDSVQRGQLVMEDKKVPGVHFTAPGSGRVVAVHRGARRAFQSLVIELDPADRDGRGTCVSFASFSGRPAAELDRQSVVELLIESGEWTALRTRPFSRTPDPATSPHSIFVTAADSSPLAPDLATVLAGQEDDFRRGLEVLLHLTDGAVHVCTGGDLAVDLPAGERLRQARFTGPHPAGTVGLHIHTLDPVDRNKTVWHVGLQDTVAIGHLFRTGELQVARTIALAGPLVKRPRLLRTRLGAASADLVEGELDSGGLGDGEPGGDEYRIVSGSVLSGRSATGDEVGYLGRFHQQLSVLREDRAREFLGWLGPGLGEYSMKSTFLSSLIPGKKFALTTSTHGSRRAIVPIGAYEKVMPFDLLPTHLLRALSMVDVEVAERLGCLELDEEDVALCTFVCPGKNDYGPLLREVLTVLEKEG